MKVRDKIFNNNDASYSGRGLATLMIIVFAITCHGC